MNICIVHYAEPIFSDPDATNNRYIELGRAFINLGHNVFRIAPSFAHRVKQQRPKDQPLESMEYGDVLLVPTVSYKRNRSFNRLVFLSQFVRGSIDILCDIKPDIVVCAIPVAGIASGLKSRLEAMPFIVIDYRDEWPETQLVTAKGFSYLFFATMSSFFRKKIINDIKVSDFIVALSSNYLSNALSYSRPHTSGKVLPLGAPNLNSLGSSDSSDRYGYIFLGTLHDVFDFDLLFRFWDKLNQLHPQHCSDNPLYIIGDGPHYKKIVSLANKSTNVFILGRVNQPEAYSKLLHAKFGLLFYKAGIFKTIPNKFFEYCSAALPIISNVDGDAADLLLKYQCGVTFRSSDPIEMVVSNVINTIDDKEYESMQAGALTLAKEYDRSFLARQFSELVLNNYHALHNI